MKIHKDWKPLVKEIRELGYDVVMGGKHLHIKKGTQTVGHLPCSTSDHRALKNARAQLRNTGILPR